MGFVRHIIGLIAVLLFSALGAVAEHGHFSAQAIVDRAGYSSISSGVLSGNGWLSGQAAAFVQEEQMRSASYIPGTQTTVWGQGFENWGQANCGGQYDAACVARFQRTQNLQSAAQGVATAAEIVTPYGTVVEGYRCAAGQDASACAIAAASLIPTGKLVSAGYKFFIDVGGKTVEVTTDATKAIKQIDEIGVPNRGTTPTTTAQTQNLRTNMSRDGMRFDPGEEAHHIVALNDSRASRSRELLEEAGVDINSPANGVPLPGTRTTPNPNNKAVHRGDVIHSREYYEYVESRLESVPASQRPQTIREIASELERGEINW